MATASRANASDSTRAVPSDGRSPFFVAMAALLLVFLAVGFARTFFLRSYFGTVDPASGTPSLPWHVYLHGSVMTAWFVVLFAQTSLVAARRTDLHRVLGVAGAVLAALIVVVDLWTVFKGVPRNVLAGATYEERRINVFGNLATLLPFAVCVATGVARRREPDVHKRFMLVASIAVIGQATQRIGFLIGFNQLALLTLVGLASTLVVHDLWSRRRVHWATASALGVLFASVVVFMIVARSPIGPAVLNAFS